ncbi:PfkB family carbohydrate kinase [Ahrensia sp. R2A130]|uniref:PfkB family carbohydrate kinase n=1 Tax=Ahrensia sp. R2A130 TaxID=744979 RepID=UPI0001E09BF1|nr:PfkB family carbohydrate kinase [Ahrensia sp. R2A130]EFL90015.1 carbohydrate kinase protein [Ahrensia sp. R2A130]
MPPREIQQDSTGITLAGAAHRDRTARIDGRDAMGRSNPGAWTECLGGAAWNVAVDLAALGHKPALHTVLGQDQSAFQDEAERLGINLHAQTSDASTASYSAIVDRNGDLLIAVADMDIYRDFSADPVDHAPALIVDANLETEAIEALCSKADWVAALAVSAAKAPRLERCLDKIDLLLANASEVEALGGLNALADHVSLIVSSDGAGVLRVIDHGEMDKFEVPPAAITGDVVGAGDALAAGYLHCWLKHQSFDHCATFAIACAQAVLAVNGPARHDLLQAATESIAQ